MTIGLECGARGRRWCPAALFALLFVTSCSPALETTAAAVSPPPREVTADGAQTNAQDFNRLANSGHWEFVHDRFDGRFMGRSARSFHAGDALTMIFNGEGFRLYGVSGPNGGIGTIVVPGRPSRRISFYSAQRRPHVLLYASPRLKPGLHSAGVVVTNPANRARGYVNIDEVQIVGHAAYLGFTHHEEF